MCPGLPLSPLDSCQQPWPAGATGVTAETPAIILLCLQMGTLRLGSHSLQPKSLMEGRQKRHPS